MTDEDVLQTVSYEQEWGTNPANKGVLRKSADSEMGPLYRVEHVERRLVTRTILWSLYECTTTWRKK